MTKQRLGALVKGGTKQDVVPGAGNEFPAVKLPGKGKFKVLGVILQSKQN